MKTHTTTNQIIREFEEAFGYDEDGVFRMDIDTSDRDAVQDFLRTQINSLLTSIQEKIREADKKSLYDYGEDLRANEVVALIEEFKAKDI